MLYRQSSSHYCFRINLGLTNRLERWRKRPLREPEQNTYHHAMPELLAPKNPKNKILLADLIKEVFGIPWWWCAHPSEFVVIPWWCFGIIFSHVDEVLDGHSAKRLFWYLNLNPRDISAFLIEKFRNSIPLVRSDSTVPAI